MGTFHAVSFMKILTCNFNKKSFITGILSVILQKFSEQIMTCWYVYQQGLRESPRNFGLLQHFGLVQTIWLEQIF